MKKIFLSLILFYSLAASAQNYDKQIKEFDAYVEKARNDWNIPGLAIAVVKDGKVLFKKGYGVRQLGQKDAVDTQTLFACASTTKAMTATCLGMLVDEGKLKWDDAVIQYLPEYQLYDPYVTRELKIRDLLIHDSGVGNADFVWTAMDISADEILKKMLLVKPSYSLRAGFIYQNIFYIAAGKVIEKVSGKPWETFIQERIFTPLQMTRTAPMRRYIKDNNLTTPHYKVDNVIVPIGYTKDDAVGPAGSVWSSIDDMSKWVTCMLDSSKYLGGRLIKAATWTEMFKPQTLVPPNEFYPTMQIIKPNWTTYGFGWFQHDYKGKKINFHTGSLAGLTAINAQLPSDKLGVYVFGNYDHGEVRHALIYKAFDLFALGGTTDWSTDFKALYTKIFDKAAKVEKDFEAKRVANTNPSLPPADYAGKYTSPLYGEAIVTVSEKQLSFSVNKILNATLEHWHYDTFYGSYEHKWYGKVSASFSLNPSGKIDKLSFDGMEFKREEPAKP